MHQIVAIRTAGTKVTAESFANWKYSFEREIKAAKKKEAADRLAALPLKEREAMKIMLAKPTGLSGYPVIKLIVELMDALSFL